MIHSTHTDVANGHIDSYFRFAQIGTQEECWSWTGPFDRGGYSTLTGGPKRTRTGGHRVAYILFRGDIPEGLVIDHLCRNRGCVNPWHLEAVTSHENTIRQRASGVCRSGRHEMTEANSMWSKSGKHRRCRTCFNESAGRAHRRWLERQKATA